MNNKKFIDCAIEALKKQKKIIAWDANIGKLLDYKPPEIARRIDEYDLISDTIEYLESIKGIEMF